MSTTLLMILLAGALLCAWALLSTLASERHRLLSEMEARRPRVPPAPAAASPAPPRPPAPPSPRPADADRKSKRPGAKRPSGAANAR